MRTAPTTKRSPKKIRYRDDEWAQVTARARECGLPPATFVRRASLGASPRAHRQRRENDLIYHLGRLASELDELAGPAAPSGEVAARSRLDAVLEEVLAAVRRIG